MDPVSSSAPSPVRRVARQLESVLASDMLRSARPQKREGMFDGGIGAGAFDSFMDNAMGEAMMQRGGLGLAPAIESLMQGRTGGGAAR